MALRDECKYSAVALRTHMCIYAYVCHTYVMRVCVCVCECVCVCVCVCKYSAVALRTNICI